MQGELYVNFSKSPYLGLHILALIQKEVSKPENLYSPGGFKLFKYPRRPKHYQPRPLSDEEQQSLYEKYQCRQRRGRDWTAEPVVIAGASMPKVNRQVPGRCVGTGRDVKVLPCDIPCLEGQDFANADAVLSLNMNEFPHVRPCPLQQHVLITMESEVYFADGALEPSAMRLFDIMATTCLASDVPLAYANHCEYGFMEPPLPWEERHQDAMAVAVISNCGDVSHRLKYIQQLIEHGVTVDSYGKCMQGPPFVHKEMPTEKGQFMDKVSLLKRYKFTLAFENSNAEDYVTEKFFHALVAGSVPGIERQKNSILLLSLSHTHNTQVHLGTDQIGLFSPGDEPSYISVHDFPSAKEVAELLISLSKNKEKYEEYLNWKKAGLSKSFTDLMDMTGVQGVCRICHLVKHNIMKAVGDI